MPGCYYPNKDKAQSRIHNKHKGKCVGHKYCVTPNVTIYLFTFIREIIVSINIILDEFFLQCILSFQYQITLVF